MGSSRKQCHLDPLINEVFGIDLSDIYLILSDSMCLRTLVGGASIVLYYVLVVRSTYYVRTLKYIRCLFVCDNGSS